MSYKTKSTKVEEKTVAPATLEDYQKAFETKPQVTENTTLLVAHIVGAIVAHKGIGYFHNQQPKPKTINQAYVDDVIALARAFAEVSE